MGGVAAVVVAAGRGLRAGGDMPKQYREIAGEPVIRASLRLFARHPEVAMVQPVIHPDDEARFAEAAADLTLLAPVFGGATRQASVRAGLEAVAPLGPDLVLIHDAARPYASAALVSRAIAAVAAMRDRFFEQEPVGTQVEDPQPGLIRRFRIVDHHQPVRADGRAGREQTLEGRQRRLDSLRGCLGRLLQ